MLGCPMGVGVIVPSFEHPGSGMELAVSQDVVPTGACLVPGTVRCGGSTRLAQDHPAVLLLLGGWAGC